MTRTAEAAALLAACALAAVGVTLVNLARGGAVDAQTGLTFIVFALSFGALHLAARTWAPYGSTLLLSPIAALTAIGFMEVYRLDPDRAVLQRWWLLIAAAVAAAALFALSKSGVMVLRRYRNITLLVTVLLLLLPNLPSDWPFPMRGLEQNGSRLWVVIDFGFTGLQFQPAEIAKLTFVAFLAGYLADRQQALRLAHRRIGFLHIPEPRQLVPLVAVWGLSVVILTSQRDLGASLLLFAGFVLMLYAATGGAGYLVVGGLLTVGGGVAAYSAFSHVQRRVEAWLRPFADYEDAGYQVAQGFFGLGTGSLSGAGPGLGRPDLIPNASTDFMLAAVGEELGFAGTVAVLALFALFLAVGLGIAFRSRDVYRKLLAAGLTFVIGVQTFLIIGGVLRVVPLTGITLPFMSYGGSALVGNMLLVAILLRVSHEEAL